LKILIIGAELEGIEAVYLAQEAGYEIIVIDKDPQALTREMVDQFIVVNVFEEDIMLTLFEEVDVVLPVIKNEKVISQILKYGRKKNTPVIADLDAYQLSHSKVQSNHLFETLKLPISSKYPNCHFPVIVKSDTHRKHVGATKINTQTELENFLKTQKYPVIIEEYLQGRSFALEVIGDSNRYCYPLTTEKIVDRNDDCKTVIAPANISNELELEILNIAKRLSKKIKINGIFEIEVINHKGVLKLLTIDARLPSQTPISVYHATGVNMVKILIEMRLGTFQYFDYQYKQVCLYQQICVKDGTIAVLGQQAILKCNSLKRIKGIFESKEMITDYEKGKKEFTAIVIITGQTLKQAQERFDNCIQCIQKTKEFSQWKWLKTESVPPLDQSI